MKDIRGQAALEFLTTYGWAFLVILIMMSALAYFGVLSPSTFLPERCNVAQEFQCRDFQITRNTDGTLNMNIALQNQMGNSVNIDSVSLNNATPEVSDGACSPGLNGTNPIASQGEAIINCNSIGGSFPAVGEKQKIEFTVKYQEVGGRFPHVATGEVFATIQ